MKFKANKDNVLGVLQSIREAIDLAITCQEAETKNVVLQKIHDALIKIEGKGRLTFDMFDEMIKDFAELPKRGDNG